MSQKCNFTVIEASSQRHFTEEFFPMTCPIRLSLVAVALCCTMATPLYAKDVTISSEELAAMRAQLSAMNARIDQLEAEVAAAKAANEVQDASIAQQAEAVATLPAAKEPETKITWKGAPEIEGKGGWSFKPRGRLQFAAGIIDAPDSTGVADGFGKEVRRLRLGAEGDIPGGFGYKFEFDFAGNDVDVTDAIFTYRDDGLLVSLGHQNTFQGLEELTSGRFTSLIERAAFTDAFNFERRLGLAVQVSTGDMLLQGGLFADNIEDLSNRNWSADGRVVYLPKIGQSQLHLGASVHYADLEPGGSVRYRQRPFLHFTSSRFIDTGSLDANSEFGIGLEAALIHGPFHAAAEGYRQKLSRPSSLGSPAFSGAYAEVGYFLTRGDTRGYKSGVFDRVKPTSPVDEGGIGAIQLVMRYDYLDLNDAGVIGGKQNGFLVGLVWTPTDYTRFLLNYASLQYDDAVIPAADGDRDYTVNAFGVQAQVDF